MTDDVDVDGQRWSNDDDGRQWR